MLRTTVAGWPHVYEAHVCVLCGHEVAVDEPRRSELADKLETGICLECGFRFERLPKRGRPAVYCSDRCSGRARYRAGHG